MLSDSIATCLHSPSSSFSGIKDTFLEKDNQSHVKHYIRADLEWRKSEELSLSPSWAVRPWVGRLTSLNLNFLSCTMGIMHSFNNF